MTDAFIFHAEGFSVFNLNEDNFEDPFVISVDVEGDEIEIGFLSSNFTFDLFGSNFSITEDDKGITVNSGIVDGFLLSDNGTELYLAEGFALPLEDMAKLIEKGSIEKLLRTVFAGDDFAIGAEGNEGTFTGGGNDTLFGGEGNDVLDGGKGDDTALFMGMRNDFNITVDGKNVTVDDQNGLDGDEGTDQLQNIEWLQFDDMLFIVKTGETFPIGTDGGDIFAGTADDDILLGLEGDDTIFGEGGNDVIIGGEGDDTLYGNGDAMEGDNIDDPDKDEFYGGEGNDTYIIGKGDKVFENDGEGDDSVVASVKLKLGDNIENGLLSGGEGASIRGNELDNQLFGDESDNRLDGRDGNDILVGEGGMDQLRGGDGNDELYGGDGEDELRGDDGADTFFFLGEGVSDIDIIRDFEIGIDTINLEAVGVTNFTQFQNGSVQDGKDLIFTAEGGAQLILRKTDLADLSANDFEFAELLELVELVLI